MIRGRSGGVGGGVGGGEGEGGVGGEEEEVIEVEVKVVKGEGEGVGVEVVGVDGGEVVEGGGIRHGWAAWERGGTAKGLMVALANFPNLLCLPLSTYLDARTYHIWLRTYYFVAYVRFAFFTFTALALGRVHHIW